MANIDLATTGLGRRKFLGLTGGLAVGGAVVACGQGGTYDPPVGGQKQAAAAATPTAAAGSSDHGAPMPSSADHPKPPA